MDYPTLKQQAQAAARPLEKMLLAHTDDHDALTAIYIVLDNLFELTNRYMSKLETKKGKDF